MDYMNKHFRVTMPLTHYTLTALTTGTHSILYKITNLVNYLTSVDNIQGNSIYSHSFVP